MNPAPPVWPASSLDALLDVLVNRLADRIREKLTHDGAGDPVGARLLSVGRAAAYLGRTKEALQHMIASGKLPVVRDGRRVFVDVQCLDRWIESHTERTEGLTQRVV